MKEHAIFRLFKNLSKKEFSRVENFFQSPFCKQGKQLTLLLKEMKNEFDLRKDNDNAAIVKHLCDNTAYSEKTIHKLLSIMSEMLMFYNGVKNSFSDKYAKLNKLNQHLLKTNENNFLKKNINKASDGLSSISSVSSGYFLNSYYHQENLYSLSLSGKNLWKRNKTSDRFEILNNLSEDIYLYGLISIVTNYVNYISQAVDSGNIETTPYSINVKNYLNAGRDFIAYTDDKKKNIIFNLYEKLFNIFNNLNLDDCYSDYKNYFFENINMLAQDIVSTQFALLFNYCEIVARTRDYQKYTKESIELLEIYIHQKLYKNFPKEFLHSNLFHSYVLKCFALKEFEKIKSFTEQYSPDLKKSDIIYMNNFAMAHYYYGLCMYGKALMMINDANLEKFIYKYDIKTIELKIYFEDTAGTFYKSEQIYKILHNFISMVKNEKNFTSYDKMRFIKMVHYYRKLILYRGKLKLDKSQIAKLYKLKNEISKEKTFVMRIWVTEKVNDLLKIYEK